MKPILLTAHQGSYAVFVTSTKLSHCNMYVHMHVDVVPVEPETVSDWHQPPFSGYYDGQFFVTIDYEVVCSETRAGEWIWGRGSCDDKSNMIASM